MVVRFGLTVARVLLVVIFTSALFGCTGVPDGVAPVRDFDLNRYLGKWYEIARLDHSFERGLQNVTANYSLRDDGGVTVTNRGFAAGDNEWKEVEGKAYFVGDSSQGHLKVSFFGPIYTSYVVFELDTENYEYAFVSGVSRSYLWLLSRSSTVSDEILERFKVRAEALGFDISELIMVDHS